MANEVTINIESSLAAMAFVVADQQQNIKELNKCVEVWEKDANTWEDACHEKEKELETLQERFHKLEVQKEQAEQRAQETDHINEDLKKQLDYEAEQHRLAVASIEAATLPRINWIPWNGETVSIPVSDLLSMGIKTPTVLWLYRVDKDGYGMNTITTEQLSAGEIFMNAAMPCVSGEYINIENNWGVGVTMLAYAIIDHRNLLAAADNALLGK